MNKRIKELANDATDWCIKNANGTPIAWEWEDKFAEMIIKECLIVVADAVDCREPASTYVDKIKDHFGVE